MFFLTPAVYFHLQILTLFASWSIPYVYFRGDLICKAESGGRILSILRPISNHFPLFYSRGSSQPRPRRRHCCGFDILHRCENLEFLLALLHFLELDALWNIGIAALASGRMCLIWPCRTYLIIIMSLASSVLSIFSHPSFISTSSHDL